MGKYLNKFQERKIDEFVKSQDKDLDEMQQHIYDMVTMYGLNNSEVAALLTSIMIQVLSGDNNKKYLDKLNLTPDTLGLKATLLIQEILTDEYVKEFSKKESKPK